VARASCPCFTPEIYQSYFFIAVTRRKRKISMSTDKSQQAQSRAEKSGSKVSIIIWIVILLILLPVIASVLYMVFTDSGQVMLGNISNQGLGNWLFGEGNVKDENEAAAELEKCGVMVIKEQGNQGVSYDQLHEGQKVSYKVTSVDFSNCLKPTDETVKQITKLRHLSTANFLNAEINDDQLAYLKNMNHLSNLLINGTPIGDAGLAHLTTFSFGYIPSAIVAVIVILIIYFIPGKWRLVGFIIGVLMLVGVLWLNCSLLQHPPLQTLHACYTKITDKGMENIAKVPTLTILNISGTDISDKGIKQIAQLPDLNWLLIQGTKVTDAGLSELAPLKKLGRLSLSKDMKVTTEGIQKLKQAIPKLIVDVNKAESPPEKPKAEPPAEKPAADAPPAAE
jgi:hypothetical protein